jgi:lipopolysaccharide export system permease protein
MYPSPDDPVYKSMSGQFFAELHDRFMSPIYPFVFAILTFAFLGTPRTTRQSRGFAIGCAVFAVFGLRMIGFACSVMSVKTPAMAALQYAMLVAAGIVGIWIIVRGIVVDAPSGVIETFNKNNARLLRLFGRPAAA